MVRYLKGLVSVIIPMYNAQDYIEVCLKSICEQTYSSLQIIVVDDRSEDASLKICERLADKDARIVLIKNEMCLGVSEARNRGLDAAQGEYVAFVDADDWVDQKFIEKLVYNIKNVDVSICGYEKTSVKKTKKILINEEIDSFEQLFFHVLCTNQIGGYCFNKLYRRDIIGDLRFDKSFVMGEDIVFVSEYLKKTEKFRYLNEVLYFYRYNEKSTTRASRYNHCFDRKKVSYMDACDRLSEVLNDGSIMLHRYISYRIVRGSMWVLLQLIYARSYEISYMERIKINICANYDSYKYVKCGSQAEKIAVYISRKSPRVSYMCGTVIQRLFPHVFLRVVTD